MEIYKNDFYDNLRVHFGLRAGYCDEPAIIFSRLDLNNQRHTVTIPLDGFLSVHELIVSEINRVTKQNVWI